MTTQSNGDNSTRGKDSESMSPNPDLPNPSVAISIKENTEVFKSQNVKIIPVQYKTKKPDLPDLRNYLSGEKEWTEEISSKQNIGVVMGKPSDNLAIVDVEKIDPDDYWNKTEQPEHLPVEENIISNIIPNWDDKTLVTKTGSGGFHLIYKVDRLPPKTKSFIWIKSRDDIYKIDFKVTGYCVEAGSIHPDGGTYEFVSNVRLIATVETTYLLKRIEKCGFKPLVESNSDTKFTVSEKDILTLKKGGWVRGTRRRYFKSLYIKLRFIGKTEQESRDEINSIIGTLPEPLSQDEISEYFNSAESFYQAKKENNTDEIHQLEKLSDIDKQELAGETIRVNAIVSSNSITYNVPAEISILEKENDEKGLLFVPIKKKELAKFIDITSEKRFKFLHNLAIAKVGDIHADVIIKETKTETIKKIRIRPVLSSLYKKEKKFFDEEGNEWASYDCYIRQNEITNLEAGKEVELTGTIIPDPKSGKIALIVDGIKHVQTNNYDESLIYKLKEKIGSKDVNSIMNWYTSEFVKYSNVIGRENVTIAGLLGMFSPIYITFEGKQIPSWSKIQIIGDSTTGKSETIRQLIVLCKAGQIISGEMATVAGLAGASVQSSGGQWMIDFGVLVLNDSKFLAVDGSHKIKKEEMDKIAEAERSGKIEITKAGKGEAYARTRTIKISNPVDDDYMTTVTMGHYLYPVQSLKNILQIQSIARLDFACFVSDDIEFDIRNVRQDEKHEVELEYLSELIKFAWSKKYSIEFSEETIDEILKQTIELEKQLKTDEIPLISNDEKFKVAKLASTVAILTLSLSDDFTKVIVKPEHVKYVAELKIKEYSNAGLNVIADQLRLGEIDTETMLELTDSIMKKANLNREQSIEVLSWIGNNSKFNRDELMEEFVLSRDNETKPLIGFLKSEKIIKQNKTSYSITKKGVQIAKFILKYTDFSRSSHPSEVKTDTPQKNNFSKKVGVSLLQELERLERLNIHNIECKNCNSTWKNTKTPSEEIEKAHVKNNPLCEGHVKVIS